jgi:hypothetical protein
MEKVICSSVGSLELCQGCGAARPHWNTACEPCPINKNARCVPAGQKNEIKGQKLLLMIRKLIKKIAEIQLIIFKRILIEVGYWIGFLFANLFIYLCFVFISMEPDVWKWRPEGRFVMVVLSIFLLVIALVERKKYKKLKSNE